MNYTELTTAVQDTVEKTFTASQMADFTKQAEQKIYTTVQFPALRKNVTGTMTASNQYIAVPTDYLWIYSISVTSASRQIFLINKDVNFVREAYPNATVEGTPKHYALFSDEFFLVGPTPDDAYVTEIHYGYSPESIVTATNTWLGDNYDVALFNGVLVEAARFMKEEADIIANYDKKYQESIVLLRNLADGLMREDAYRSGQYRFEL